MQTTIKQQDFSHIRVRKRLPVLIAALALGMLLTACSSGPQEKPVPAPLSTPDALQSRGIASYENGKFPSALVSFDEALQQYRNIDDREGIASTCLNIAKVHLSANNLETAAIYLDRANQVISLDQLQQLENHYAVLRSSLLIKQEKYADAIDQLAPALADSDPTIALAALKNRCRIAFAQDQDKQEWLQRYTSLQAENPSYPGHKARILRFQASLQDRYEPAMEQLQQSLQLSRQAPNHTAIAASLEQVAALQLAYNKNELAQDSLLRALYIRHFLGDVAGTLQILRTLEDLYPAGSNMAGLTAQWIKQLESGNTSDWEQLYRHYDPLPGRSL